MGQPLLDTPPLQEELVLRLDEDAVTMLILSSPQTGNALTAPLLHELAETLAAIGADEHQRVVVLAANGPCFGSPAGQNAAQAAAPLRRVLHLVERMPQIVIAKVHGPVRGPAVRLVACCDLAVAASEASFDADAQMLGPNGAGRSVVDGLGRKAALEVMLGGRALTAHEARALGMVNRVAARRDLDREVMALARTVLGRPAAVTAAIKRACAAVHRDEAPSLIT